MTGALFPGWLALILILPTVPPVSSQSLYPESLDLANLKPWRYTILRFEGAAIGDVLQRTGIRYQPRITAREQHLVVRSYMAKYNRQLNAAQVYHQTADPLVPLDLARQANALATYQQMQAALNLERPLFERVVHRQVADELARTGLTVRTFTFPPVLFRLVEPPLLLTISPRAEIRSLVAVFLRPETPIEEIEAYEESMLSEENLSAYVSRVGGVATYPTTVMMQFRSLPNLFEIVAHEWVHTYLVFHKLGIRYFKSEDFQTLNETAATIIGQEISQRIMLRHYRDLLPSATLDGQDGEDQEETEFDFHSAMRETRLETDRLLAIGQIEAAESYMEARLRVFQVEGYNLRKLNQAYFAFHGTYATAPSSSNPIGPLMLELRALMSELRDFVVVVRAFDDESDLLEVLSEARYRLTDLEDPYSR